PDAITVVLIILGGVDAPLGGDAVRPASRILKAKSLDVVPQLAQRRGRRCSCQPRADDENVELPLVGRADQLHFVLAPLPLFGHRPRRSPAVERRFCFRSHCAVTFSIDLNAQAQSGKLPKPAATMMAKRRPTNLMNGVYLGWLIPSV